MTLITRREGSEKTLNMSMTEQFFSVDYAGGEICLRGFPSGKMRSTGSFRGRIRLSAFLCECERAGFCSAQRRVSAGF